MPITRRLFLFSAAAVTQGVSKSWEQPAFPDWSTEFIERVLTDSPWARPYTAAFDLPPMPARLQSDYAQIGGIGLPVPGIGWPGGRAPRRGPTVGAPREDTGGGTRTEAYLTIRWSSALPIRQALALKQFGREGLHDERALKLLARADGEHVLEVFGFPANLIRGGSAQIEKALNQSARLSFDGRKPLTPSDVYVPEHGYHLAATLRFARIPNLHPELGMVRFSAEVGPMKLDQRFKLRDMVYRGELEV